MAEAVEWVAQVTAVPLTMGLLGWVGYKLDQWLGTSWLALVGVLLGLVFGMVHLLMKVSAAGKRGRRSGDQDSSSRH